MIQDIQLSKDLTTLGYRGIIALELSEVGFGFAALKIDSFYC